MKIGVGIYVRGSAEAAALYERAFGLELGYHVKNPDGSFFHAELCRDGRELFDVIESPGGAHDGGPVQISAILDDEAAVRRAYALLSEGGTAETPLAPLPWSPCAGTLRDRFGVWWYLSAPGHYPPADYDPFADKT